MMDRLIGWLAPILSTIIITAATASINAHIKRRDKVADERHAETGDAVADLSEVTSESADAIAELSELVSELIGGMNG